MTNDSSPAIVNERRRADRVQEAIGIQISRLQDQPAAGDATAPAASPTDPVALDAPTHKSSLSSVGLAFAHEILMHPGELIALNITLFPSGREKRDIKVDARVVSANDAPEIADGDKPTYRIAFESIAEEDREFIETHVQALSKKRPAID